MRRRMSKILERIERQAGIPGLASLLAERLTPTDLQSLLLEVYRVRSARSRPADILRSYESDRFVRPSSLSPDRLLAWEQIAFSSLPPEFEPMVLSPVCPLGASSAIASVDQNWAVATARNTEVVSDSTNVLALECAVRRRMLLWANPKSAQAVHLPTSHRLLRAQQYQSPDSLAHFSCFALCRAGRDTGASGFEVSALSLHIRFYLSALRGFLDPDVPLRLALTDFHGESRQAQLEAQLLAPIRGEYPWLECGMDNTRTGGKGYYIDLCAHIYAADRSGRWLELVDGGSVNWTQRLLSNPKERLVISGMGSERLCSAF